MVLNRQCHLIPALSLFVSVQLPGAVEHSGSQVLCLLAGKHSGAKSPVLQHCSSTEK